MVLLCKGLPQEILDFNGVIVNEAVNNTPAQKATGSKTANQMMITFILIIHGYSYVNEVKLFVKQIDGVERVKGDEHCNVCKLEVAGKVDPFKIQEMVERETKKKVELIFPSSQMGKDLDKNLGNEEKLKKGKRKIHKNIIANKKSKERLLVLKIQLCCDSCNQKLRENLKMKGLETITMDVEKSLVTVKSSVDPSEIRSYFKDELKKYVEIIEPAEVAIPTKKKNSTIYKKEVDDKATPKKDKGSTATFYLKYRGGRKADENEDDCNIGEKKNNGGREAKPNVFSIDGAGKERSRDDEGSSSSKKDEDRDGTKNVNAEIYYRSNDDFYALHQAQDLEDPCQMFNDENAHSCFIM